MLIGEVGNCRDVDPMMPILELIADVLIVSGGAWLGQPPQQW